MIFIFKAVGQSIKAWILTHKKLYFFIVGFIAFLAFTIITLVGLGKVYDAEAATDNGSISVPYGESSTYSLGLRDYPYYVVFTNYLYDTEHFVAFLTDEPMSYGNGFSDTDLLSGGVRTLFVRREKNGDGEYVVIEEDIEGNMSLRYLPENSSNVYSNYDIMRGSYEVVFSANPLPVLSTFDKDAPYIKFKRLNVRNKLASGDYTSLDWVNPINDMDKYIEEAYWEYCGYIENFKGAAGYQYTLDINFTVEFPHLMYVVDWMNINNVGHTQTELMTNIPLMIAEWNLTNSNQKYVFTTSASIPVIPNDDGYFSFRFSFLELCQLLVKGDPDALELFDNLDKMFESFIIPGLHVDSVASLLTTVSNGSSVIGKYSIDYFERGVLNDAMSVYIDLGSLGDTEEERDEAIRDAVSEAVKEQNKELQDRVDGLEEELEHIYAVDGTLSGELSSTDLWNGFWNLSRGLANVGNSVSSISVLTGQVFGFMPSPVTSIMQFTLVAICVIAIIKAIRG